LSKFKKDESGLFFNERLETEIIKRKKHSEKQKENALMRWHKSGIAVAMPLENENENENIIDNGLRKRGAGEKPLRAELYPSFDDFWGAYQKKRGRDACEKKWGKLAQSDREACIAAIPAYIQATPDPQFRKDPLTYLNQKSWNDEIITGSASKGFKTYDHANRELAAFVSRRSYPEGGEG
jgi:hypothetical protein